MAKPKETFNKREKEKKRLAQRQEKKEKMEERKANASKGKSLEDMMAYIDENGNISATPPDPRKRKEINAEDIQIGVPRYEHDDADDGPRTGTITYFQESKGFGFIQDSASGERIFIHVNAMLERVGEGDKVEYEVESGPRGLSAANVKKASAKPAPPPPPPPAAPGA